MPRSLFVASYDSQLKWCVPIAAALSARGHDCRFVAPAGDSSLSPGQIAGAGAATVETMASGEIAALAAGCDVVAIALTGRPVRDLAAAIRRLVGPGVPGPVLVTGWVGLILQRPVAGYLDRCGCDLLAVNARSDEALFRRAAEALGLPADNLLFTGLPFLPAEPAPERGGPIRRLLYADQPTVPKAASERAAILARLDAHAAAHPDRIVTVRPRARPGEGTVHRVRHHPERLLPQRRRRSNLVFDHRPMRELLAETDLLATFSSTAAVEALALGVRTAILTDFGIDEVYGNTAFLESGLLRSTQALSRDDVGHPAPAFLADLFPGPPSPAERIADAVERLLRTGERPGRAVAASPRGQELAALSGGATAPRGSGWLRSVAALFNRR